MIIVFFRHGKAVSKEEAGSDEERWLTEQGRRDVEAVARLLPFKPSVVYTSPLKRARETAEIIARLYNAQIVVTEALAPGADLGRIASLKPRDYSVLVGHNPDIEDIVSQLTGCRVKVPTATAVGLNVDENFGEAVLLFMVTPEVARRAFSKD